MCLNCEREEMWAAYRDYVARRAAGGTPPANDGGAARSEATPEDAAWAAGTWFEIKTPRDA